MSDPPLYSCWDTRDTHDSIKNAAQEANQLTGRFGDTATLEYAWHRASQFRAGCGGRITAT
jgi:hypothetical protein